ncbi:MAG: DNA replication/repair protein RecF [Chloroflexi bacterium]|nr:DNA replication/repair protein RecF [Chloroflexota bacterium]
MYLRALSLTNFRNYASQTVEATPGVVLLLGENAQGKTNVLEAISLLATGRADRAEGDADYIAWSTRDETQPFARVMGTAVRGDGEVTVELTVVGREGARGLVASKRFKVNGVAKRGTDAAGQITAVLFTTNDMELVRGSPGMRRRYLDVMLTQADHRYGRTLSRYNKVITQRNALLKRIQEGDGKRDELDYWDEEMAREATGIAQARAAAVAELAVHAAAGHARLSGERERFEVAYAPRFAEGWKAERIADAAAEEAEAALLEKLRANRSRDIAAGVTLSGPHRDDLSMTLGGEPAASFASRGQQRTAALSLRLAEARLLYARSGEKPVLLLDDVLSELDASRRASVLAAFDVDQAGIPSPDPDRFDAGFRKSATVYEIVAGVATRAT